MHLDQQIPPWKLELLSRRNALSRTLEPSTWKSVKDGAPLSSKVVYHENLRPLSSKAGTNSEGVVTCATSLARAPALSTPLEKGGAFESGSSALPLSSSGWPAHRPSRLSTAAPCSSLDKFRTSATDSSQAAASVLICTDLNALPTKRVLNDQRPPIVRNKPACSLKMGEDTFPAAPARLESDSDSSEGEIHYGPGFVSRLKSRYMSAALRSSSNSANGSLRRTASLEDFLDKDKEEVSIELEPKAMVAPTKFRKSAEERPSRRSAGVAGQVSRKSRESIKRCQSVEVLARHKLEADSKPPPLPPKSSQHIESVLNSEALANDKIELREKASSATVIASLRRPFHHRRRSAGLLFGVEEKELPAPDTVKETRKIFETKSSKVTRPALMKSRSTSSLYSIPPKKETPAKREALPKQEAVPALKKSLVKKPALPAKPELTAKNKFQVPALRPILDEKKKWKSVDIEEGIKIVSKDSIDKIREGGESISFNFKTNKAESKPYLPHKKTTPPPPVPSKADTIDTAVHTAVPVGVIKPITRSTVEKEPKKQAKQKTPTLPKRAESPTTTLNNLINLTKQNNPVTKSEKKKLATPPAEKKAVAEETKKEVILVDKRHEPSILKTKSSSRKVSTGNKIVTFAEEIEAEPLVQPASPTKDNSDEGIDNDEDMEGVKSNYRESWKKRQEAETKNTMVFNFLNSQKDVTHIENDGLDLSKRKKKQHLQQMAKVRHKFASRLTPLVISKSHGRYRGFDFYVTHSIFIGREILLNILKNTYCAQYFFRRLKTFSGCLCAKKSSPTVLTRKNLGALMMK